MIFAIVTESGNRKVPPTFDVPVLPLGSDRNEDDSLCCQTVVNRPCPLFCGWAAGVTLGSDGGLGWIDGAILDIVQKVPSMMRQ